MSSKRPENEKLPTNIRRAPKGRRGYQVRYYDDQGKRRTKTEPTLADAAPSSRPCRPTFSRGTWVAPEGGRVLFGKYAWHVENIHGKRRANTKERDETVLRSRLIPAWGDHPIGRITRLDVQAWVDELIAEGLAPSTIHKVFRLFARVLDEAVDDQLIGASPCRKVKLPEIEVAERFALEPEHVQALADAVPDRYRALVLTTAATGLRWGEVVGLKVRRVDMLRRELNIAETLVEILERLLRVRAPQDEEVRRHRELPRRPHGRARSAPRAVRGAHAQWRARP